MDRADTGAGHKDGFYKEHLLKLLGMLLSWRHWWETKNQLMSFFLIITLGLVTFSGIIMFCRMSHWICTLFFPPEAYLHTHTSINAHTQVPMARVVLKLAICSTFLWLHAHILFTAYIIKVSFASVSTDGPRDAYCLFSFACVSTDGARDGANPGLLKKGMIFEIALCFSFPSLVYWSWLRFFFYPGDFTSTREWHA